MSLKNIHQSQTLLMRWEVSSEIDNYQPRKGNIDEEQYYLFEEIKDLIVNN